MVIIIIEFSSDKNDIFFKGSQICQGVALAIEMAISDSLAIPGFLGLGFRDSSLLLGGTEL